MPNFLSALPPRFNLAFWGAGVALLLSRALPMPSEGKIAGLPSPCYLWEMFHIPCPLCGMTRAFVCCAHGNFAEAMIWHPLGPLTFFLTAIFLVMTLVGFAFRPRKWQIATLASVFVAFWILRLTGIAALPS